MIMTDQSVNLDNDAQQLYAQLGGVELRQLDRLDFSKKDKMLQGLLEEEKQADAIRFLLARMVFGISSVLHALPQAGASKNVGPTFQQLETVFGKFWQKPTASGATLIRYRGMSGEKTESEKNDYEIVCGNIMLDAEVAAGIARKQGREPSRLLEQLSAAFETFSQHGISNFRRSAFGRIIPDLEKYERRIFEFLWHNLKGTLHQKDRQAFLDSLQLLVDRLKQPKNSISVLLHDLIKDPDRLRFADQKAFMLGNRLVRIYHQEIVSYQITPEDVLAVQIGLDKKLTRYAAWKIDRNQDKFFEKIRTIHRRVLELLGAEAADESILSAQDFLALEREAYIFFALIGGNTAKSVLVSALKEYGFPESEIYQLHNAQEHLADLLQMLKVVVRGIRRQGNNDDVGLLKEVRSRLGVFAELTRSMHEADVINQIRDQIHQTVQDIQIKD
jgi:hypothetical protein